MVKLDIDPAAWQELSRLLDQALDLPPAERAQWLDALGGPLEALKPQLRDLLSRAAQIETGDFLQTIPAVAAGEAQEPRSGQAGDVVGPYRLVREIGSGGMGAVWLAERADGLINRPVALKLPHLVAARSAGLAERMAREREILASLDHRNIARLLDAGVSAGGQPFLALEYVEGVPIDAHCAALRNAGDVDAVVRLFRQVVDAVAYAHGKLVIHRDLKPANILVTAGGGVKLLDFGIAKLLASGQARATSLTELAGRALTPHYASPEQILGEPLTVASDVYSLGVVFYELLTGQRPHRPRRESRAALEEAILQSAVVRPSELAPVTRRKALRGDLDNIVLRALKRSPAERYATVNEFSEDLTRYLENRPVRARADGGWYRFRKFIARNALWVGASAAVSTAVLAGAGVAIWQAIEANAQRDAALSQQRRAEAYADFMRVLLQDAGGAAGRPLSTTDLLDRGVRMLEQRSALQDADSAYIWYELSRSYLLFVNTRREIELLERAVAGAEENQDFNLLAASHCSVSWSLAHSNQEGARARLEAGLAALRRVEEPADYAIMDCTRGEARVLQAEGKLDEAIAVAKEGRALLTNTAERKSWRHDVLSTQLAELYRATDRFKEALALSEDSLRAVRESGRVGSLAELVSLNNYSGNLCRLGEVARCGQVHEQVLAWAADAATSQNPPVGVKSNAGQTFLRLGQAQRALALADEDAILTRAANNPAATAMSDLLGAKALVALGRLAEARARIGAAEQFWNRNPTATRRMLLEARLVHADIDLAAGDLTSAHTRVTETLAWVDYPREKRTPGLDRLLRQAARVRLMRGDAAAALALATDARALSETIARDARASADVGQAALLQAEALYGLGRREDAIRHLELAATALSNGFGAEHADTLRARQLESAWGAST